ncbi:MAG: hypothetical protein ACRC62_36995 [Microcoleus sp.]
MITIGIDPGMSKDNPGGIAFINDDGKASGVFCPVETVDIYRILLPYKGRAVVAIEELNLRHSDLLTPGKAFNIVKMLRHHQKCLDVCEILEFPIASVAPMRWKSHWGLVGTSHDDYVSKAVTEYESAIDSIYRRTPGGRKIVPYSGIAAALLMAGWRKAQTEECLGAIEDKRAESQAKTKMRNNAKTRARKADKKAVLV